MPVQHVARNGIDRRRFNLSATTPVEKEQRWNKDRRSSVVDEDELLDPDWEVTDGDLDENDKIALDD